MLPSKRGAFPNFSNLGHRPTRTRLDVILAWLQVLLVDFRCGDTGWLAADPRAILLGDSY